MSTEERFFLDYFFCELLLKDSGAYVLSGTKPAVLGGFFFPKFEQTLFYGNRFFRKEVILKKGYETWMKYQHLFPMNRHILICSQDDEGELFHVLLINRKKFCSEVAENIDDFKNVLGANVTPEDLLRRLAGEGLSYYEVLNNHSALEGLILGFGKHNSWLFYRRDLLGNRNYDYQLVPKKHELIERELKAINEKFQVPHQVNSKLLFAALPCFLFDPQDAETHRLLQNYSKSRKKFTHTYQNRNFLESALRQLTS